MLEPPVSTPDGADDARGRVAELLIGLVGERHLRRDRHGVARVDAHRVEVLDRADDDDVVLHVAHDLELELVPADERLLDEHLAHRALGERALEPLLELGRGARDPAAVAAQRERRPEDQRERERLGQLVGRGHDHRLGHAQADVAHRLAEEPAVLGAADGVVAGADQLDAQLREHAFLLEAPRQVERGSAAERRQQRVRPLPLEDVADAFQIERLEVRPVGVAGVGHDRGRIRVDDDRPVPLRTEHLERLAPGVVELTGLPDHDRPGADHADRREVGALHRVVSP